MTSSAIHYHVGLHSATEHLLDLTMQFTVANAHTCVVCLPTWIPGSYMVRDFARNLHTLSVTAQTNEGNNTAIIVEQLSKQSWRLSTQNGTPLANLTVHYQVYAFDLSVRSAYINDEYAFFNGTSVFLYVQDQQHREHRVSLDLESFEKQLHSQQVACAMRQAANSSYYISNDYYELIEHPFLIGQFDTQSFEVLNKRFHLVFSGHHNFDMPRMIKDLEPIIAHHIALFGDFPCEDYWFITLVCEGGFGGLEHLASTILQYSRFELPISGEVNLMSDTLSPGYQRFLSLCSHELFHTWHVKRIKPAIMQQPDLSQEVYTEQLWIYEGFTSLYDDLSLVRAGVITPKDYLQILNEVFSRLLKNAGRHKQSVSASSFEAWSKFYKQDAGSVNHIVSYYNKGAVVALCLDITLREQSAHQYSLDDVMKILWRDFGKTNIGTADHVIQEICKREFNINLDSFLHLATQTTMDLPFHTLLQTIGLDMQFRGVQNTADKGGTKALLSTVDIGANITNIGKNMKVNAVFAGRAASQAGLMCEDEIVAVDNWQCDEARFIRIINGKEVGSEASIHVLRDGRLLALTFPITPAINDTCDITISHPERFNQWLGIAGALNK